jgi:hypothetical protein
VWPWIRHSVRQVWLHCLCRRNQSYWTTSTRINPLGMYVFCFVLFSSLGPESSNNNIIHWTTLPVNDLWCEFIIFKTKILNLFWQVAEYFSGSVKVYLMPGRSICICFRYKLCDTTLCRRSTNEIFILLLIIHLCLSTFIYKGLYIYIYIYIYIHRWQFMLQEANLSLCLWKAFWFWRFRVHFVPLISFFQLNYFDNVHTVPLQVYV